MTKRRKKATTETLTTGQVCDLLGLTEQRLQVVVRGMPRAQRAPVVAGKRAWGPTHVEALRARLAELEGRRS